MQIGTIKLMDRIVGGVLCLAIGIANIPFAIMRKFMKRPAVKKILVVQLWGIGETITTLPALRALRKRFSGAEITILATRRNKDVYFRNPDADKLVEIDFNISSLLEFMRRNYRKFDLVIDMEEYLNVSAILTFAAGKKRVGYSHGLRSLLYTKETVYNDQQHSVFAFMDLARTVGAEIPVKKLIPVQFDKHDAREVDKWMKERRIRSGEFVVGIAPGSAESAPSRKWQKEKYAKLADSILERYGKKGCWVIFFGSSDERALVDEIMTIMKLKENVYNAAGFFTVRQLFCALQKCKAFVGNDSGPMHIAAAQGVKTLGLFGPNTPVRWAPYGEKNAFVYHQDSGGYTPCINTHKGQVPDCLYSRKSAEYQKCMKAISVDNVMMAFGKIAGK